MKKSSTRKLWSIGMILLGLLTAYSILFLSHRRALKNAITLIEEVMKEKEYQVKYDMSLTSGLNPWNIKYDLVNIEISSSDRGIKAESNLPHLIISSDIIAKTLRLDLVGDLYHTVSIGSDSRTSLCRSNTSAATIDISLSFDWQDLLLDRIKDKDIFRYIASAQLQDLGVHCLQRSGKEGDFVPISRIDSVNIGIDNLEVTRGESWQIDLIVNNLRYLDVSLSGLDIFTKEIHAFLNKTGSNDISGQIMLSHTPNVATFNLSENTQETNSADEVVDLGKNINLEAKELLFSNDLYSFKINGTLLKEPNAPIPYFNMNIGIHNFDTMISHYIKFFNTLSGNIKTQSPQQKVPAVLSKQQISDIESLFKNIGRINVHEEMTINLVHDKLKFTIGEMPASEFVAKVISILLNKDLMAETAKIVNKKVK